jgi:hypothetical protein
VRLAVPDNSYYFELFAQAQGLLGLSWDIEGAHAGILFLDKLVEKSPDAITVFYGDMHEPCFRKPVDLIFLRVILTMTRVSDFLIVKGLCFLILFSRTVG